MGPDEHNKPPTRRTKRLRRQYVQYVESGNQVAAVDPSSLRDVTDVTLNLGNIDSVKVNPSLLTTTPDAHLVQDVHHVVYSSSSGPSGGPSCSTSNTTLPEILVSEPQLPVISVQETVHHVKAPELFNVAIATIDQEMETCGLPTDKPNENVVPIPTISGLQLASDFAPSHEPVLDLSKTLEPSQCSSAFNLTDISSWIHDPIDIDEDPSPMLPDTPEYVAPSMDFLEKKDSILADDADMSNHTLLYEGAKINKAESMVAIISFIQSEHLSGAGTSRLLSLLALHLPTPNSFFKSSNELLDLLGNPTAPPNIFHFCSICLKARANGGDLCDTCKNDKKTIHSFLHFPLEPQLTKLYSRPGFLDDIKYKWNRTKINKDNYEDVYDSKCYQEAEKGPLSDGHNISFQWNTDGLQVFKSSLMSMWPFYLVVNELPPHKRYLTENMLLAGIWFSSAKPHPNIFLQPIYNDLQTLKNGIFVKFFDSITEHKIIAVLLCGTMDSPARALFLNIKIHSGFFSCFLCLCKGENSKASGGVTVFPFERNITLRTTEEYVQNVQYAVENRVICKKQLLNEVECSGVKGPTLLFYMLDNMFESVAIDSMHCVYQGVARQIFNLMFHNDYSKEPFSVNSQIPVINSRIKDVKVPHFLERAPQGVDKLVHWKASELRSFLFYIALLVLNGILKPEYFENLVLLVHGVALLNTSSISENDVQMASDLLTKFAEDFQTLYGLRHMSSNMHSLLHLAHSVRNTGPLWISSCFKFEDMNGRVLNLIHGTRHAGLQVCSNLSVLTGLPLMVHNLKNEAVKRFCLQMRYKWLNVNVSEQITDKQYCVGDFFPLSDDNLWIVNELVTSEVIIDPPEYCIQIFHRLLKDRVLYYSSSYKRNSTVSSYAKYMYNDTVEYRNIMCFVRIQNVTGDVQFYAVINRVQTEKLHTTGAIVGHVMLVNPPFIGKDIVAVQNLKMVLYKTEVSGKVHISVPLNVFELE